MSALAVDMVDRDMCYSARDVHCEEGESDGDVQGDGGVAAEDGDGRGIGFFEVLEVL